MKERLIQAIQRAIVLYVKHNEGKNYRGNNAYDLKYIRASQHIPDHRKRDILELEKIFNDDEVGNDIELASDVYDYLQRIKTGFLLFWLIQIGNSSWMRDSIHNAIFLHDPDLLTACKQGKADRYRRKVPEVKEEMPNPAPAVAGPAADNIAQLYVTMKKEQGELKGQVIELGKKLSEQKEKNAVLQDNLDKQIYANEALRQKMDKIIQKKENGPQIQMATPPTKKGADTPLKEIIVQPLTGRPVHG